MESAHVHVQVIPIFYDGIEFGNEFSIFAEASKMFGNFIFYTTQASERAGAINFKIVYTVRYTYALPACVRACVRACA